MTPETAATGRVVFAALCGILAASSLYTVVQLVVMLRDIYRTRQGRKSRQQAPARRKHRILTP